MSPLPARPFFIGLGMIAPVPFMVLLSVAAGTPSRSLIGTASVGVLGLVLIFVGLIRTAKNARDPFRHGYRQAIAQASAEVHQALLEAGEDPRAADSMRNRIRGLAGLAAL